MPEVHFVHYRGSSQPGPQRFKSDFTFADPYTAFLDPLFPLIFGNGCCKFVSGVPRVLPGPAGAAFSRSCIRSEAR